MGARAAASRGRVDPERRSPMRFRARITLVLVLVGVLPTVLLGWSLHRASRDELAAALGRAQADSARELARECGRGVLAPVVDGSFPFAEAARAHARLQSRQSFGKVLLAP